jgi:hypothetical protein
MARIGRRKLMEPVRLIHSREMDHVRLSPTNVQRQWVQSLRPIPDTASVISM